MPNVDSRLEALVEKALGLGHRFEFGSPYGRPFLRSILAEAYQAGYDEGYLRGVEFAAPKPEPEMRSETTT